MKILTWPTPNFGDRLNDIIWPELYPELTSADEDSLLIGIGSLLNHRLPTAPKKYILGSGVGHGLPPSRDDTWNIVWLRGPLSAQVLQAPVSLAVTDGAVLIKKLIQTETNKIYDCSFLPHTSAIIPNALTMLKDVCELHNINLINPHADAKAVIREINSSKFLITEALHGAITADTLRVPWKAVTRKGINSFKWRDWSQSMGVPYKPVMLPYRPQWFAAATPTRISRRTVFPLIRPASRRLLGQSLCRLRDRPGWIQSDENMVIKKLDEIERLVIDLLHNR